MQLSLAWIPFFLTREPGALFLIGPEIIVVIIIVAQFLAHKTVHFASLTCSFIVSLSKFLNVNMEYTKQLFGPEKLPELSRNRPLVPLLKGGVFLGICGRAVLLCSFCYFKLIPQEIIPLFQVQVGVNGTSLCSCRRSMEHKIGERTVCLVCSPKLSWWPSINLKAHIQILLSLFAQFLINCDHVIFPFIILDSAIFKNLLTFEVPIR